MRAAVCLAVFVALVAAINTDFKPVPMPHENVQALRADVAERVNSMKTTWTASADQGNSAISGKTLEEVKRMLGAKRVTHLPRKTEFDVDVSALPASFDARQAWANCPSIGTIRDQSSCGSCWAFGAVEAMSDRSCIFLKKNISLSTQDMNSCCDFCGAGCGGGDPAAAWDYWVRNGVATNSCSPYSLPSCDHHISNSTHPCPSNEYPTPACKKACVDGSTWSDALHYGSHSYSVSGHAHIMQEIYTNGPVETAFSVYEDFLTYKGGVYKHTSGQFMGGHAVKILGWGTMNGSDYWIVANSWNPDWGVKGYFYMLRGTNECGFESEADAGVPKN